MVADASDANASIRATGIVIILGGVALGLVRYFGGIPPERTVEGAAGAAAFGAVIAAPGVLALLALAGRPALLLPAALVLVPMSFLSFALVTLPLLIPAFLLLRAFGQRSSGLRAREVFGVVLTIALLAAALLSLFLREDPRETVTATSFHSTSDVISWAETLVSLGLTSLAILVGAASTRSLPGRVAASS